MRLLNAGLEGAQECRRDLEEFEAGTCRRTVANDGRGFEHGVEQIQPQRHPLSNLGRTAQNG